jgi:hypothetical protein
MIRLATRKEAIEIMEEPQIVGRVGVIAEKFLCQPYLATNEEHRLLFVFWETEAPKVYEMHIASPRKSLLSCRKLATEAMEWVFKMGADKIVTSCPKGKISNMAKKLGMTLVHEHHYYEVEKWQ